MAHRHERWTELTNRFEQQRPAKLVVVGGGGGGGDLVDSVFKGLIVQEVQEAPRSTRVDGMG